MKEDFRHVSFTSAGAGSGKTYHLTEYLERVLVEKGVNPGGVIATTFTVKAAGEIEQQVRKHLIDQGHFSLEPQMGQALIGTVHSVCERLLQRFAFELGLSPQLQVVSLDDTRDFFDQALDEVLDPDQVRTLNALAIRLSLQDWSGTVKAIADEARGNDMSAADLARFGRENANALLAFFPPAATGDPHGALLWAVDHALAGIDLRMDTTKGTKKYVGILRDARNRLVRRDCPWTEWMRLSRERATKASEGHATVVRVAAARYDANPEFQQDIRRYIVTLFDIAGSALERFQQLKRERGLIDFTDMEQLMLHALDNPLVRSRLDDELELLLVDEFQDTNPMQLALFMKLALLADDVVFVGDVKQAIYAFRGCDPDLLFKTLEGLAEGGSHTDVLQYSWRARPALVHYLNTVFSRVFDGQIPAERVALAPKREEYTIQPAVMQWTLKGSNNAERWSRLAAGITQLIDGKHPVVDRESGQARPVRWGDVAVLARTNDHVEEIAKALRDFRVPMKMTLPGLSATPEVCLARACLRCLNDPSDTLATAEVVALSSGLEPEQWLEERLRWLDENVGSRGWGKQAYPVIATLAALRGELGLQSPVETVARVLNAVDIRRIVAAWGPDETQVAQRQRNLDAFLNLAVEYENHSEGQQQAASLTGFLLWLEAPRSPELDLQPTVTTGNAVHVLTYHRAKGLEWPVVITADFLYRDRGRLWDARVETDTDSFDIHQPLSDRTIRYWPYLFGNRSSGIPVLDAIKTSAEGRRCVRNNDFELKRLAYVGLSRARDLLVMPIPDQKIPDAAWLNVFKVDQLIPEAETLPLPDGHSIPTYSGSIESGDAVPMLETYMPRWFEEREPSQGFPPRVVNPSNAEAVADAKIAWVTGLGEGVGIDQAPDMREIGLGLHAVIAAELINPGMSDAESCAEAILAAQGVASYINTEQAVAAACRFRQHLHEQFDVKRILTEWPVAQALDNGQLVKGWVDVLVETEAGYVIIDHKSSPRTGSEWAREALEYSGQLKMYKNALEASGNTVSGTWIHFPVSGGMVEVALN